MSKFTTSAATAHMLSLTAMEEASRLGQRTADIDHLFLALVVSEQLAGQVLRGLGITLDSARDAVAQQHAEQLASLGIDAPTPSVSRIVFHETGGYEWSERALKVIKRSSAGKRSGDASAVLRELIAEPSGLIEAVLMRLGAPPKAVLAKLDQTKDYPAQQEANSGRLSGASEAFVPAPVDWVWALLTDPTRMPEWEPSIGNVDASGQTPEIGTTWAARTRTQRSDGKPVRVKPEFITQRIEFLALERNRCIAWRFAYPDAPNSNAKRVKIALEPTAGGTKLRLAIAWEPNPERRQPGFSRFLLRPLIRPWTKYLIWIQLSQLSSGISRALR